MVVLLSKPEEMLQLHHDLPRSGNRGVTQTYREIARAFIVAWNERVIKLLYYYNAYW